MRTENKPHNINKENNEYTTESVYCYMFNIQMVLFPLRFFQGVADPRSFPTFYNDLLVDLHIVIKLCNPFRMKRFEYTNA